MVSMNMNTREVTMITPTSRNLLPSKPPPLIHRAHSDAAAIMAAAKTLLELTPSPPQPDLIQSWKPQSFVSPLPKIVDIQRSAFVSYAEDSSVDEEDLEKSEFGKFYTGTTSLHLDTDEESLSAVHCFMRKYCVEVFTATESDVRSPRAGQLNGSRVGIDQVGIRCMHCKTRPYHERQERSVCFPSSLKNIYHSIETWQRRHSLVCQDIPDWIKRTMVELMAKSKTGAGGRRKYWEESAIRLGMATTPEGIRFIRPPGEIESADDASSLVSHIPGLPVVREHDQELVTDYLFLLLDQMEVCHFTEDDRSGGRSKVKNCVVGYPGMQCKHCAGKAGFGRYFPATCQALTSANSDRNIHNHLTKCRRCPPEVLEKLGQLHKEQQNSKNRRGSRKEFFLRVWDRLHDAAN